MLQWNLERILSQYVNEFYTPNCTVTLFSCDGVRDTDPSLTMIPSDYTSARCGAQELNRGNNMFSTLLERATDLT